MQRFNLGRVVATPGALDELGRLGVNPLEIIGRHVTLDPGVLDADDREANDRAVDADLRVFSAYVYGDTKFYCITEADRSSTCILLPNEY